MPQGPLFPEPETSVAIDLAGLSFAASLRDVSAPREVAEAFEHAHALMRLGEFQAAAEYTTELRHSLDPLELAEIIVPIQGLEATALLVSGAPNESENDFLRALAAAKSAHLLETPLGAALLNNLGVLTYSYHKRPEAAEEQISRALSFLPDRLSDRFHQRPTCLRNLGVIQDARGERTQAAQSLRKALDETTGDPRAVLDAVDMLVANREKAGDLVAVEALLVAAFSVMERSRAQSPETFILAARNLSLFLLRAGELDRLGPIAKEQSMAMRATLPPQEKWRMTPPVMFLALHHANAGNWARASAMLDWVLELDKLAPESFAGADDFFRNLASYYRKEGLVKQFTLAAGLYRMLRGKMRARDED